MHYTIDRIEEGIAIFEDENGEQVKTCSNQLPKGAKEGDILSYISGQWRIEQEETRRRRQGMRERLKHLAE